MKRDITQRLKDEHQLILRMLALLEKNARLTEQGSFKDYRFYLDGVDFIRNYADRFHHAKEEDILFEALIENGMPRANSPVAAMLMEHDHGRAFVRAMEEAATRALNGEAGPGRGDRGQCRGVTWSCCGSTSRRRTTSSIRWRSG